MKKVVLASNNQGKISEFNQLLQPFAIELVAQSALGVSEIEETGSTFVENALLKARHAAKVTGLPAIADDSGLLVDHLNGAPGIYSARYAGKNASATDNIEKLLQTLKEVPDENRHAAFYCVLIFLNSADDPAPVISDGRWPGIILREAKGTSGFGYDPIFYLPELRHTAAELAPEVKNRLSHRGMALTALVNALRG